jgi:hypothetical protein
MGKLDDPKERVEATAGIGGYGADFTPQDTEFQQIRTKARAVLDGRAHFSFPELEKIVAQLMVGR